MKELEQRMRASLDGCLPIELDRDEAEWLLGCVEALRAVGWHNARVIYSASGICSCPGAAEHGAKIKEVIQKVLGCELEELT